MNNYKECGTCMFERLRASEEPCSSCLHGMPTDDPDYPQARLLWEPKASEAVNHPSHYNQGKFECIDVMVETFGNEATQDFCVLNAFKYIWRSREKGGVSDLEKALWYLKKYLELEGASDDKA